MSKTCSRCGRIVSSIASVGNKCPHCGAIWNFERHWQTNGRGYGNPGSGINLIWILILILLGGSVMLPQFLIRQQKMKVEKIRLELSQRDFQIRAKAAADMSQLTLPQMTVLIPDYLEALKTAEPATRALLLRQLAECDANAKRRSKNQHQGPLLPLPLLQALQDASQDQDIGVQKAAVEALRKIRENP